MFSTRKKRNPTLVAKIEFMRSTLQPLVRVTDGSHHPAFPLTILNYHLLTHEQCDELAHHFHQRTPSIFSDQYPTRIYYTTNATLEEKRRRIGRFIGLRGCESPIRMKTEEEILREAENARQAEEEKDLFQRKARWY